MTSEEIYYRRTYKLLDDLIYTYRNGYDKKEVYEFWKRSFQEAMDKPRLFNEKREGLLLTIIIALMGVNKESIEKAEIIDGYKESLIHSDFRNADLNKLALKKVNIFESSRTKETIFDNWLSIIKSPDSDKSNEDIIRRIRNGLLHSNFNMDTESRLISFTNVKTKSYYEAKILNQNFQQFMAAYYANVPTVGLCEKTILFYKNYYENIKNEDILRKYLENLTMVEISHSVDHFDGFNSLDNKFSEILKGKNKERNILRELNSAKDNGINIKDLLNFSLSENSINGCIEYFKVKYGDDFYKLYDMQKEALINSYFEYMFENKRQISNWLLHFYHLIAHLIDPNFDVNDNFYKEDEYAVLSLEPTLAIIKGYLILYRLQNNMFDKINISDIDFDFDADDFYMWSEVNGDEVEKDFYLESFNKKKTKNDDLTDEEINKSIICDVIRDGLAHGNISCFIDTNGVDNIIEIKDINKKNNHARCIQMKIEKFNRFLESEAFLPKYCINKEKEDELKR